MKVKDKFKKIASLFFLAFICLVMSSCCNVTMDINKDGSGQATILIAKEYQDELGNNVIITREDVDKKLNDIILAANVCSGEEDRVKIKKVKELDDCYEATLSFMRIQYLSKGNIGGDLGIYSYKKSKDFILESDSVSLITDSWFIGAYKNYTKLNDGASNSMIYKFDNQKFGDEDAAIAPVLFDGNKTLNEQETIDLFKSDGMLAKDKKGQMFTFFLADFEGLESITFNFKGNIKAYGSKNVSNVSKNSITIKPVIQKASIINSSDQSIVKKDVNCFAGYVYFTLAPNYVLITTLSLLGIALVTLIIIGIVKGVFKKIIHSKKMKLIVSNFDLYLMLLPSVVMLFIFSYIPMGGIIIAFKNYRVNDGIWNSEWSQMFGMKNFVDLFTNPASDFGKLMKNTFILAFWKFIFGFLIAITLAVLFNYLKNGIFKKFVQTVSYFPYFISWVVISTLSYVLLATDGGTFNKILEALGKEPINFYSSPQYWRLILTSSAMWKTAGYSTIVYLAAMAGIDKSIYEAARIDGAGGFKQFLYVTLPGLLPAFGIQVVFSLGNLVRDDFDQIYTMIRGSAMLRDTTDTIGMIVFENIGNASNYSGVAAMSMLQSLIALVLVIISNKILKKKTGEGAY